MPPWNITESQALYNIKHWSEGYFDINEQGEVIALPTQGQAKFSLYQIVQDLKAQGFSLPILLRFPNILQHRVNTLHIAFKAAMQKKKYAGNYTAVYPIKVNQQHDVVEAILQTQQAGLEAGSKAELMAVLALAPKDGIVICNGYKDAEYIRFALMGQQMGMTPYLVIEKISELQLIIEEAQKLGVVPRLGVRVKLASIAQGKWQDSGGEKSKFGLNAAQILEIITRLRAANLIDSLQLMHFHIGSQIANIRDIQQGLYEAGRYYAELHALNVPIDTVDVGGGLAVDYEGMHSRRSCSMNYSLQEYANNVIYEFNEACKRNHLPHPNIITESGRAITAHHAVLVTNVTDSETIPHDVKPALENDPEIIQDLWQQLKDVSPHSALEVYHNAEYWLNEMHSMFSHGVINLGQRAHAEQLYHAIALRIQSILKDNAHARVNRDVLDQLNEKLADKYFVNFSLFRSVPDAWAIDQLFPVMPLHRLDECPQRRARLQDLTCDSDGQFENYVSNEGIDSSLAVHELLAHQPYLIGIFLVGAYQEILGDMHNLFGETHSANIHIAENGEYQIIAPKKGNTVENMLNSVNFNTERLLNNYRQRLQETSLDAMQQQSYLQALAAGLDNYTYLKY